MKYNAKSLGAFGGIALIVSPFVPDNRIVFRERRGQMGRTTFAAYKLAIWDLDTGKVGGDADITKADEMHVSAMRYDQIVRMVVDERE